MRKQFKLIGMMMAAVVIALMGMVVSAQGETLPNTLNLGGNDDLGAFLVGPNGMTLYTFSLDDLGVSNCADNCAVNWPPFTVESADGLTVAEGIPGEVGAIERADGSLQVTYNDQPLYYWPQDAAAGDATGNTLGDVWWIVPPATVYITPNADLGPILVGPTGMTVYLFTNDEAGVSNCADDCAVNWPPVIVESADALVNGVNLPGELTAIERADGSLQVAYNGMPLYYWMDDAARGDTLGEGLGDVWYTIAPEVVALSSSDELGEFLVAANGMTLYIFTNDEAGVSNCADDCAVSWPPLVVAENVKLVAGPGIEGELSTVERADGSFQVAYNGMPLYFWMEDAAPGDTTGHTLGDVWFVAEK